MAFFFPPNTCPVNGVFFSALNLSFDIADGKSSQLLFLFVEFFLLL
jgi:hypothetical protein